MDLLTGPVAQPPVLDRAGATSRPPETTRRLWTLPLARSVLRLSLVAAGALCLWKGAIDASGGYERLWRFGRLEQHRFQSMALLTGTLRLRNGLHQLLNDEQAFNGAGYTNWGFGVPL